MKNPSKRSRAALVGLTAGSIALLAACGSGDTQAADGSTSGDGDKTIAFSPLALKIPAMKGLSEGVTHYGDSKGYEVLVQDPNLDPQKQVTDLQSVIESGRVAGAWAISIDASSMKALVEKAQADKVPLILNGTPELYGLSGPQAGLAFSTIDYVAQGKAIGEELGNCINEKLDGKAQVLMEESAPGTAGKEEIETAAKEALAATAPDAEIVATIVANDRAQVQTDIGSALQGHPDVTVVLGNNDEGALGAIGAFKASGKDLTCLTEAGGNDEVLAAVKAGKIYASVALQFQDAMVQDVDHITTMLDDPTADGEQISVPQKVLKTN
ncbi:MAG: sugar ABC transporter substrate-binding protein [Acidimicrobiales bacterium]